MCEAQVNPPATTVTAIDPCQALQSQFNALQSLVYSQKKVWYKDASSLIALTALGLSLVTTVISVLHTRERDVQGWRQDLRAVLERLAALPKESVDMQVKYKDNLRALDAEDQALAQESTFLARQSSDLGARLPDSAISSAELSAIALAQQQIFDYRAEAAFLARAEETATSFSDELVALRIDATLRFIEGNPDTGRQVFQQAMDVPRKYNISDQFIVVTTNMDTQMAWGGAEGNSGLSEQARQHFEAARKLVETLPDSPQKSELINRVAQMSMPNGPSGVFPPSTSLNLPGTTTPSNAFPTVVTPPK